MAETSFVKYMNALRDKLKSGDATEHTHRPSFQVPLEELHPDIEVINEPKQISCGASDFVIRKSVSQVKTETSKENDKAKPFSAISLVQEENPKRENWFKPMKTK